MPMTAEQRRVARADLESKQAEADALVRKDAPTGDDLTKAEGLYDACDRLVKSLDDDAAEAAQQGDRVKSLQGRGAAIKSWREDPDPAGLPVGAKGSDGARAGKDGGFRVAGLEPGGSAKFDAATLELISEVGPGLFGEKQWAAMCSVEYKRDFIGYLRKGNRFLDRSKALQVGLDDQGGVLAPADWIARIVGRLAAPTMLRGLVQTLTTGRNRLELPRLQYGADDKYSTGFRASWVGERPAGSAAHAVSDANLFAEVGIDVYSAMISGAITNDMIEDAAFPIQAWFEGKFSETIDLLYEDMILNGSGVGQPHGLLSNVGAADRPEVILSGTAGALAHDGLIDLQTAIAPQYEAEARFVMNKKSTYRALCKLKDGQNRPLFSQGYGDSGLVPPRGKTLLGDPITLSQFMPDVGASNYPIIYGDLRGYYLVQRVGFALKVLDQTRAHNNEVEIVGRVRFGGKPVEHWRMKIQKSNNS